MAGFATVVFHVSRFGGIEVRATQEATKETPTIQARNETTKKVGAVSMDGVAFLFVCALAVGVVVWFLDSQNDKRNRK